jgi:hypothetical protein
MASNERNPDAARGTSSAPVAATTAHHPMSPTRLRRHPTSNGGATTRLSTTELAPPRVALDRVPPKTILALSIAEAKRLLRHPVLLAGAALGSWLSIQPWLHGEPIQDWPTQNYEVFLISWAPLYVAAFIAANAAALRERETTTAEMFRSTPTRYTERTIALLAAGLAPTTLAAMLAAIQLGAIAQAGGITVGNQLLSVIPSAVEMALVPATTAVAFACGVALARTIRSRVFGVTIAAVGTYVFFVMFWLSVWMPAYFLTPYATSLRAVGLGQELVVGDLTKLQIVNAPVYDYDWSRWSVVIRDVDLVGWHNVYLIGLALLLSAYAVRRSGRDWRVRRLLLPGVALTIGGLALHMANFGGPFDWGWVHGL